jgi:RNA polymerase sigma-70 factor (ECF subfamily)
LGIVVTTRQARRSDEELVERSVAGDLDSFAVLVERHQEVVLRVAARIVGPTHADDVAQDAFLRAFHRLTQFRGESTFRSWLLRIAHNTALTLLEREQALQGEEPEQESTAPHGTPADELVLTERRSRLAGKLRLLSPAHRTVLVLRDLEGLSYEEIADVTDTPLGSVKGRLHRARRELIEILRANTYDWELPPA